MAKIANRIKARIVSAKTMVRSGLKVGVLQVEEMELLARFESSGSESMNWDYSGITSSPMWSNTN